MSIRHGRLRCGLLPTRRQPTNPAKRRAIRNDPGPGDSHSRTPRELRQYPTGSARAILRRRRATQIRPLRTRRRIRDNAGRRKSALSATRRHGATTNSNHGGAVLESNTFDAIAVRLALKALRFWEARETLSLIITASLAASIVAMIWLPWITGKPTMTVLELPVLVPAVRALCSQGRRLAL
jgi:hypothetical protein